MENSLPSIGPHEWKGKPTFGPLQMIRMTVFHWTKDQSEMRTTNTRAMSAPRTRANPSQTQIGRRLRINPGGGGTISGRSGSAVTVFLI
jgi:hypothetical protein